MAGTQDKNLIMTLSIASRQAQGELKDLKWGGRREATSNSTSAWLLVLVVTEGDRIRGDAGLPKIYNKRHSRRVYGVQSGAKRSMKHQSTDVQLFLPATGVLRNNKASFRSFADMNTLDIETGIIWFMP